MENEPETSGLQFVEIAETEEIPNGERLFIEIGSISIVIFNINGSFYAIDDVCTHDNGPLGEGELDGYEIVCPRHGARFDIRGGKAVSFPAVSPTQSYPVRVVNGMIEIGI